MSRKVLLSSLRASSSPANNSFAVCSSEVACLHCSKLAFQSSPFMEIHKLDVSTANTNLGPAQTGFRLSWASGAGGTQHSLACCKLSLQSAPHVLDLMYASCAAAWISGHDQRRVKAVIGEQGPR